MSCESLALALAASLPSLVRRLAGALAELWGWFRARLVDWLWAKGLITSTYPSPLFGRLLEELPDVLAFEAGAHTPSLLSST
jgi:hypothetical protein